jgi:polyhydroxyalkanoate synthase
LLAITLAHLADTGNADKIKSSTFLTTLLDFEHAGELKLFIDEAQIDFLEGQMKARGYLDALYLQRTFSSLRANDLIWSFVVNNYLMGKEPSAFDLLYWNNDSTNLPMRMGVDYLRWMYLNNDLIVPGKLTICGTAIDLGKIRTPAYFLSTHDDHIAPWHATFSGPALLGGDCVFTLAKSGHIAGVVNPPSANKYGYYTSDKTGGSAEEWLQGAIDHNGSWWTHWQEWEEKYAGPKMAARSINNALSPAPGEYVRKKI